MTKENNNRGDELLVQFTRVIRPWYRSLAFIPRNGNLMGRMGVILDAVQFDRICMPCFVW